MTTLSHSEKEKIMADMKSFDEPMPAVGIFWYDPDEHDFFGVYKKELTPKMVEDADAKGINVIDYEQPDHDKPTHGRVFWDTDKFIVSVGFWAKNIENELNKLIEKYFALPYFEYRYYSINIDDYRFTDIDREPPEEYLAQLMHEVAVEAKERYEKAHKAFFAHISEMAHSL